MYALKTRRTSDNLDLGNTVGVTEDNTDLRRGGTLTGELADLVDDLLGGGLEPCRGSARVGDGAGRNALALGVKTAHFEVVGGKKRLSGGKVVGCSFVVRVRRADRRRQFRGLEKKCQDSRGLPKADE